MSIIGMVIIESITACFLLIMICVICIANGPVNMVYFYEKEVQDRVVQNGLITKEEIKRKSKIFYIYSVIPMLVYPLIAVYAVNGAVGFIEGFWQICTILVIMGLFDRIFIDWYWVGNTKAWIIDGTEDLMPYIYGKTLVGKWLFTLVGFPLLAVILSAVMSLFIK